MDTAINETLRTEFDSLLVGLGANSEIRKIWTDALIQAYSEPQRHYHTTRHIHAMLQLLQQYTAHIDDLVAVQLSIYFHDWVYDPRAKDNEVQSVVVFDKFAAQTNLDTDLRDTVRRFIESTITHSLPADGDQTEGDLHLFLDFDLEVLSRPPSAYQEYADEIRQEYIHVSEDDYKNGRAGVLKKFLERPQLYFSSHFSHLEDQARANLKQEIQMLSMK